MTPVELIEAIEHKIGKKIASRDEFIKAVNHWKPEERRELEKLLHGPVKEESYALRFPQPDGSQITYLDTERDPHLKDPIQFGGDGHFHPVPGAGWNLYADPDIPNWIKAQFYYRPESASWDPISTLGNERPWMPGESAMSNQPQSPADLNRSFEGGAR